MMINKAYEVRVKRRGRWCVEAIFDDENLAITAARHVEFYGPSLSVVVLQEIYDAARNHLISRSIYRSGKPMSSSGGKTVRRHISRYGLAIVAIGLLLAGGLVAVFFF